MKLIACLFFLSGCNALIFEVVWTRGLSLLLGSTTEAQAIVTSAFMLGLGLGAWGSQRLLRFKHPLLLFAGLEICIAVLGGLLTLSLPRLAPFCGLFLPGGLAGHLLRFLLAWAVLLGPCMAMGASLPILIASQTGGEFRLALATLYGVNTLGAAAGAFGVDAFLIPRLGVCGSGLTAALGDIVVATMTVLWARRQAGPPEIDEPGPLHWPSPKLALLATTCGFAGFVAQIVWTRTLVLVNGSDAQAFSVTLATYLLGLAIGSFLLLFRPSRTSVKQLIYALCLLSLSLALSCHSVAWVVQLKLSWEETVGEGLARWGASCLLILPATILLGALFTMVADVVSKELGGPQATAAIYLSNTAGSVTGALLTGYWFLPVLGIEGSLMMASGLVCLATVTYAGKNWRPLVTAALVAGVAWRGGSLRDVFFQEAGRKIIFYGEDHFGAVAVTQDRLPDHRLSYNLVVDGFNMAGDDPGARRYTFLLAFAPLIHHGGRDLKALVICLGVGNTARAATYSQSTRQVDCVEVSATVIKAFPNFPHAANLLSNPKFHVLHNDGRNYLLSTTEQYDIITAEPPPPKHSGVVNLYSKEYYQLCRNRLRPGGVVAQWLPVWEMNRRDVKGVVRAFCDVFPYCYLWEGDKTQLVLTGSLQPAELSFSRLRETFAQDQAALRQGMWNSPELLAAALLLGPQQLREYGLEQPALTDDDPYLQYGLQREPPDLSFFYQPSPPTWSHDARDEPLLARGLECARRLRVYVYDDRLQALERVLLGRRIFETYPGDPYYQCQTLSNDESLAYWQSSTSPARDYQVARILILRGDFAAALGILSAHTELACQSLLAVALELAGKAPEAQKAYQNVLQSSGLSDAERTFLSGRLQRLSK